MKSYIIYQRPERGRFDMEVLKLILTILQVLGSLFLITVVLLQSGKRQGLSGAIGGGAETFFGKNKGRAMDAILSKATTVVAIVFVVLTMAISMI